MKFTASLKSLNSNSLTSFSGSNPNFHSWLTSFIYLSIFGFVRGGSPTRQGTQFFLVKSISNIDLINSKNPTTREKQSAVVEILCVYFTGSRYVCVALSNCDPLSYFSSFKLTFIGRTNWTPKLATLNPRFKKNDTKKTCATRLSGALRISAPTSSVVSLPSLLSFATSLGGASLPIRFDISRLIPGKLKKIGRASC